jgi:uncharacterized protein with PIN domain
LDRFLRDFGVVPVAFGEEHWRHPAALNFGDCLSYATAKLAGHPLLFIGEDFSHTDIEAA